MKVLAAMAVGGVLTLFGIAASAAPIPLTDPPSCNGGTAIGGITVNDVTIGGMPADNCWGIFGGNDPGPSGDGFDLGGTIYDYVAKQNTPGILEGADIGLNVTPAGGALSGDWSYDDGKFMPTSFLIVLKAANDYGVWLMDPAHGDNGTWSVWGQNNLSHLTIYAPDGSPPQQIPEPGTLGLLGVTLLASGLGGRLVRRKKRAG